MCPVIGHMRLFFFCQMSERNRWRAVRAGTFLEFVEQLSWKRRYTMCEQAVQESCKGGGVLRRAPNETRQVCFLIQACFVTEKDVASFGGVVENHSCCLWSRLTVHISLLRQDNDIHIFDVLTLATAVCIFIKSGSRAGSGSTARPPSGRSASDNRETRRQTPAPLRTVVAHRVANSGNCCRGVTHPGSSQLRACNSCASSMDRCLRAAPLSFARTATPAAVSPARPACATRHARRQCAPHNRGLHSGRSLSANSRPARVVTAALDPFSGCAPLHIILQLCALWSPLALKLCLSLSHCLFGCFNSLARTRFTPHAYTSVKTKLNHVVSEEEKVCSMSLHSHNMEV